MLTFASTDFALQKGENISLFVNEADRFFFKERFIYQSNNRLYFLKIN